MSATTTRPTRQTARTAAAIDDGPGPIRLPDLFAHPAVRALMERRSNLAAELGKLKAERLEILKTLPQGVTNLDSDAKVKAVADYQAKVLELARGVKPDANESSGRAQLADMDGRIQVVRDAIEVVDRDLSDAKQAAARELLPEVREATRPAVCAKVRALLSAVAATYECHALDSQLEVMGYGPAFTTMGTVGIPRLPFNPAFLPLGITGLNEFGRFVNNAVNAGIISREEAAALKARVPGCG